MTEGRAVSDGASSGAHPREVQGSTSALVVAIQLGDIDPPPASPAHHLRRFLPLGILWCGGSHKLSAISEHMLYSLHVW